MGEGAKSFQRLLSYFCILQCFHIRNQNLSQHLFCCCYFCLRESPEMSMTVFQTAECLIPAFTVLEDIGQTLKGFLSLSEGWGRREFKSGLSVYFVLRWRMVKLTVTDFCKNSLTGRKIGGKERSIWKKGEYLWCLLLLRKEKKRFFRKLKVTGSELILSILRKSSEGAGSQFLCDGSFIS